MDHPYAILSYSKPFRPFPGHFWTTPKPLWADPSPFGMPYPLLDRLGPGAVLLGCLLDAPKGHQVACQCVPVHPPQNQRNPHDCACCLLLSNLTYDTDVSAFFGIAPSRRPARLLEPLFTRVATQEKPEKAGRKRTHQTEHEDILPAPRIHTSAEQPRANTFRTTTAQTPTCINHLTWHMSLFMPRI